MTERAFVNSLTALACIIWIVVIVEAVIFL